MRREIRTAVYDDELHIEAYSFQGIEKPFLNHFHEYYVIGYVEKGTRVLSCKNKEYRLKPGNIVLFNPGDSHGCIQCGGETLDYRSLNISKKVMLNLAEEVTGKRELPGFSVNLIWDAEAAYYLRLYHEMMMKGTGGLGKEEALLFLITVLIQNYGQPFESCVPECREKIEKACSFMEQHYQQRVYLEQICNYAGLSKSTLLRAFTKSKGVTTYRYLENIRINEAKKLLEQGTAPADAAIQTGFSDQSHFTNYFSSFIGLAPGIYQDIFTCNHKREDEQSGK